MYPLRTSKPEFDEKNPRSLRRYFEDVDELCTLNAHQTSKEKIRRALYYTPDPDTEDLWRSVLTADMTWEAFKTQIIFLYPGAEGGFSYSDLEWFLHRTSALRISSAADIGQYHRQFTKMANHLMSDNTMTALDANHHYIKGFSKDFWDKIQDYFNIRGGAARSQSRDEIYKAALWVARSEKAK